MVIKNYSDFLYRFQSFFSASVTTFRSPLNKMFHAVEREPDLRKFLSNRASQSLFFCHSFFYLKNNVANKCVNKMCILTKNSDLLSFVFHVYP